MTLIRQLWSGRSLENPATPLSDPDEWLYDALGGEKTDSGIRITQEKALTYGPFWAAVNLISRSVAKLPLIVYRREGEGKTRDPDHPAYALLKSRPNPDLNYYVFRMALMAWALIRGNGYAYIRRLGDGTPLELWPLASTAVYPVRVNGLLWYVYTPPQANQRKLPADDVLHIRGIGDDLEGWSVLTAAKAALGLGIASERNGTAFFANGARPDFVIEHPKTLNEKALKHLRDSWNEMHQGLENAHKPAVLEEGMKINPLSLSNIDAQFIESRRFQPRVIANFFNIPPHKVGDDSKSSYNSLEQENQSFLDECLDPWLVAWEAECWQKLLTTAEQTDDSHVIEFQRAALVRANLAARGAFYAQALQAGWMCRDEVRGRENMNPMPNGQGRVFYMPANMAPARADQAALASALRKSLEPTVARMTNRVRTHRERAAARGQPYDPKPDRPVIIEAVQPILAAARAAGLSAADAETIAEKILAGMEGRILDTFIEVMEESHAAN